MTTTVEMQVSVREPIASNLHRIAKAHSVSESTLVEKALILLFELDTHPQLKEFWFSALDGETELAAELENWIADEEIRQAHFAAAMKDIQAACERQTPVKQISDAELNALIKKARKHQVVG